MIEQLESRQLLAPLLDPSLQGLYTDPKVLVALDNDAFGVDSNVDGVIAAGERPTSLRIEAAPRGGGFNGELFAIARGPYEDTNNNGAIDLGEDLNLNGQLDCIGGRIYKISLASGAVTRFSPSSTASECVPSGTPGGRVVPGGGDLGFGGYTNFFDIAIDPFGIFDGKPAIYVSTVDNSPVLPGVGATRNAIYRLSPSGEPLDFFDANGSGTFDAGDGAPIPFAMFTEDKNFDGTPDDVPAVIAFAPRRTAVAGGPPVFSAGLYVGDVDVDSPGDTNDLFVIQPSVALSPITATSLTRIVIGTEDLNGNSTLDAGEDLNGNGVLNTSNPTGVIVNTAIEARIQPPNPPMAGLADVDLRGFAFGSVFEDTPVTPARAGESALYTVSTDIEDSSPAGADSFRLLPPTTSVLAQDFQGFNEPIAIHHWADVAFDPVGFFQANTDTIGGMVEFLSPVFETDMAGADAPMEGGALYRVEQGFDDFDPFMFGFRVPEPDLAINPTGGLEESFSVTIAPDGRKLCVSDLDAIYCVDPLISLDHSEAGQLIGLSDLRDLGIPYRGSTVAVVVIDSGVDKNHGGFAGHVTDGINVVLDGGLGGGPGTFDIAGHGTSVAGIISQIVPDATIVPIQLSNAVTGFTEQQTWSAIKYVADNPTVVDPVTGNRVPIVAVNMSFGSLEDYPNEADAFASNNAIIATLKEQFRRYIGLGITPVVAAGNEGQSDVFGLSGADIPAVIRGAIDVVATYAYPFSIDLSPSPLDNPQGFSDGNPQPSSPPSGCALEGGDLEVFVDKVTAFSSRSPTSDFAAPGSCIRTFTSTYVQAAAGVVQPIELAFNGTSSASPLHAGQIALVRDAVNFWRNIFGTGGATTDDYLSGPAGGVALSLAGIRNLGPYTTADGVNSILQWTAIPILDVDLPNVLENDDVDQLTVRGRQYFRTYARSDVGNAVAAIEGAMAFDYLNSKPLRAQALDINDNGVVTASEIEAFIADPAPALPPGLPAGDVPEIKAMARLIGGTDIAARVRRMQFFDLAADQNLSSSTNPSISLAQFGVLRRVLLPKAKDFSVYTPNSKLGFLLAPDRRRYEDLRQSSSGIWAPTNGSKKPPAAFGDNIFMPISVQVGLGGSDTETDRPADEMISDTLCQDSAIILDSLLAVEPSDDNSTDASDGDGAPELNSEGAPCLKSELTPVLYTLAGSSSGSTAATDAAIESEPGARGWGMSHDLLSGVTHGRGRGRHHSHGHRHK